MFKLRLIVILFVFSSFQVLHKFYVSVTDIKVLESKGAIQITSRIFLDDLEIALQNVSNDPNLVLSPSASELVGPYVISNFEVLVNDIAVELNYLGEEFDDDMIYVYMEVEGLVDISSLKIGNSVLFDVYDQQEHVIKIKTENKSKSFILTKYKPTNVLKI